MTTTMQRFGLGLGAAAMALGLSAAVFAATQDNTAQGPGPFKGRPGVARLMRGGPLARLRMASRQLGLTDTQKQQIKTAIQAHKQDWQALAKRGRAARMALRAAVTADTPDEAAIRQRSAEVAAVQADVAVARAQARAEIFKLLTPEQQAKAKAMQERAGKRGAEF